MNDILTIKKDNMFSSCLICNNKENVNKLTINRLDYDGSVVSFGICDECLNQIKLEIEHYFHMKQIHERFCPRCGKLLKPSDIDGYDYVCYDCDENFYLIETIGKE